MERRRGKAKLRKRERKRGREREKKTPIDYSTENLKINTEAPSTPDITFGQFKRSLKTRRFMSER